MLTLPERIAGFLCAAVVGIVLIAGLWPFHAPRNGVTWRTNGLRFDRYGTVVSSKPFHLSAANGERSCALEIWLAPGPSRQGTIMAFASAGEDRIPLALRQLGENLAIERYVVDAHGNVIRPWLTVDHVFSGGPVFVTVTSGSEGTVVYIDGMRTKVSSSFGLERADLSGQLILGTSAINDSWTGQILGLALYSTTLGDALTSAHFQRWQSGQATLLSHDESIEALYLFSEHSGDTVHNEHDAATDLAIPSHYQVLNHPVLQPPWNDFHDRWSAAHYPAYWQDVGLNVVGFVPVGLCFAACFGLADRQCSLLSAVSVGFALSLTIEIVQTFLPTRSSSVMDLITNTTGTLIGAMLYSSIRSSALVCSECELVSVDRNDLS